MNYHLNYLKEKLQKWNYFYKCNLKRQLWKHCLLESQHLHNPDFNSLYRKNILHIIDTIYTDFSDKPYISYYLKPNYPNKFKKFIFNEPFKDDDILAGINKITLYVNWETNITDLFVNTIDIDNTIEIEIYAIIPHSIIDYTDFKNLLLESIPHEFQHVMDKIKNEIDYTFTGNLNEFNSLLLDKIDFNKVNINNVILNNIISNNHEFLYLIHEIIYRTSKTEIHAYLESFYNEIINDNLKSFKHSYEYQYYLCLNNGISEILNNLEKYTKQYKSIINLILKVYKNEQIKSLDMIFKQLSNKEKFNNELYKTKYTFYHLLKFWQKQLNIFLEKAELIYKKHIK